MKKKFKVLSIISTIYLIIILISFVKTPSSSGYEASIYQVYPIYFWILIIGTILIGFFSSLNLFFNNTKINFSLISLPIILIITTTILILLLPFIRGYLTFGRGDVLTHIGLMKDILITGHYNDNWYPILHVLGVQFSKITSINIFSIPIIFAIIFYLFFISGIYHLGKYLFGKEIGLIILLISLIPFLGSSLSFFAPSTLGIFLFPFLIYIFLKSNTEKRYSFLFIISGFSFIIFHPLRGIFIIFTLILICLILSNKPKNVIKNEKIIRFNKNNNIYNPNKSVKNLFLNKLNILIDYTHLKIKVIIKNIFQSKTSSNWLRLILLSSIIWISWYIIYEINNRVIWTIRGFIFQFIEADIQEYGNIIQTYSPPFFYVIKIGFFRLGILGIMNILSIIFILLFLRKNTKFSNLIKNKTNINLIIFLFFFFNLLTFFFFVLGSPGGYTRYLSYVLFFSIFLVGCLLYTITIKHQDQIKKIIYFIISIFIILSVFTIFPDPIHGIDNHQVTSIEFIGAKWTFKNMNDSKIIEEIPGISQYRFYNAIYGTINISKNIRYIEASSVEPHFGYNSTYNIGSKYSQDVYLIISKINKIRYMELYPDWNEAQFFIRDDFDKLNLDKSVGNLYFNGEFNLYDIKSGDKQ